MIDLHVHTCFSDGEHTPKEVVEIAKVNGVDTISITDHDSVYGISEAILEGKKQGICVVPGIEITAFENREVHVLGYNIDFYSITGIAPNLFTLTWILLFIGLTLTLKKKIGKKIYLTINMRS